MMKLLTAAVLVLALCFLPHRVAAQHREAQEDCDQVCQEACMDLPPEDVDECLQACIIENCVEPTPCVGNHTALKAAIDASPTTSVGDPHVIELCEGTIDFSKRILFTNRHFELTCPENQVCTLDGNETTRLFKAGTPSTPSTHIVKVKNVKIVNGNTHQQNGGAFIIYGGTTTLEGCEFGNNYAKNYGGALYGEDFDDIIVTQCSFANNRAKKQGGALWLQGTGTVQIDNSTFTSNSAERRLSSYGGAIYSVGPSSDTITGTTFSNNSATLGDDIYRSTFFYSFTCTDSSNTFCDGPNTNLPPSLCGFTATYGGC